jgi:hypothetical protein
MRGRVRDETGLRISVCHYPPGTSKWKKIEHRIFSRIATNWRGRPLTSYETIANLIGATTTGAGLPVQVTLDTGEYPKGVKVSNKEMASLKLHRSRARGEWNYSFSPRTQARAAARRA